MRLNACLVALFLAGATAMRSPHGARKLRGERFERLQGYDASTYSSITGQRPGGLYAAGDRTAAVSYGSARGIRYNAGKTTMAGDMYPGPVSATDTGYGATSRAGNAPGEANINLGRQVIAATYMGARAIAGSSVFHSAAVGATVSNNIALLGPRTVKNEGSAVAFTDLPNSSAAVAGLGNGPNVIARANEVAAMSRAERDPVARLQPDVPSRRRLFFQQTLQ